VSRNFDILNAMTPVEAFIVANPLLTYLIIFFGMTFEGEGIVLLSSIFAGPGKTLAWSILAVVIFSGVVVGDLAWYAAGYYSRGTRVGCWLDRCLEKRSNWLRAKIVDRYSRYALASKFLYFTTHATVFVAGWHKLDFKKFWRITLWASGLWTVIMLIVGYLFYHFIELIGWKAVMHRIELVVVVLIAIALLGRWLTQWLMGYTKIDAKLTGQPEQPAEQKT